MRLIFLMASFFLSSSTFAADVTLSTNPTLPVLIMADYTHVSGYDTMVTNGIVTKTPITETIQAPWFKAEYQVNNDLSETISVIGMRYTASTTTSIGSGASSMGEFTLPACIEVPAHSSASLGAFFHQDLGYIFLEQTLSYTIDVKMYGWVGTCEMALKSLGDVSLTYTVNR